MRRQHKRSPLQHVRTDLVAPASPAQLPAPRPADQHDGERCSAITHRISMQTSWQGRPENSTEAASLPPMRREYCSAVLSKAGTEYRSRGAHPRRRG